jgi:acyl dehydratase
VGLNRDYVGRSWTSPEVYEVGREKLRDYVLASGDLQPAYLDPEAAQELGHPTTIAPSTFALVLWGRMNTWPLREPDIGREKAPNMVVGGTHVVHHRPIRPGDRLVFRTTVTDIREIGGKHELMEVEHQITAEDGEPVCTIVEQAISRNVLSGRRD